MYRRISGKEASQPVAALHADVHQLLAPDEAAALGGMNHFHQFNCNLHHCFLVLEAGFMYFLDNVLLS